MPEPLAVRRTAAVVTAAILLVALARPSPPPGALLAIGSPRPDIILVLTDDAHGGQLRYFGETKRAVLDHGLAPVRFHRAYAATPLCCPSRATLLTGLIARHNGVRFNKEVPAGAQNGGATAFRSLGRENSTLATWLDGAGYRTAYVGKYLNNYDKVLPEGSVPAGWDFWRGRMRGHYFDYTVSVDGTVVSFGSDAADYSTDVFGEYALDAIRTTPPEEPLFLCFAPDAPHTPTTPAPRHAALFPALGAPNTPNHPEADVSDKPAWVRSITYTAADEAMVDRVYADGARCMKSVDEAVAAIVNELEARGRLDHALLLIMSDNGWAAGSHGWTEKRAPWEEIARVSCAAASKDPSLVARRHGTRRLVSNVDVAPTLAEIAGVVPPQPLDGVSFASLLRDSGPDVRPDVLLEYWDDETPASPLPSYCGLVNATRKYVEYADGDVELYDLEADPYELLNRANDPAFAAERSALAARLAQLKGSGAR